MNESRRSVGALAWLCWLPLLSLLATEWVVSGYDGYGAWASAPLLLIPGLLGLAFTLAGLVGAVADRGSQAPIGANLRCALIASLPILWLCIRRFVIQAKLGWP